MLANKQIQYITNKALERHTRGLSEDGRYRTIARVPNATQLQATIDSYLREFTPGLPFFNAIKQDIETSAARFNDNLYSLVDDFYILYDGILAQAAGVAGRFSSTEAEFRKIGAELRKLKKDIDGFLLVSRGINGYLYVVGDTFVSNDMVDMERTTAMVDTRAGIVVMGEAGSRKIDLGHYEGRGPFSVTVDDAAGPIDSMGTTFYSCIDDSDDTYYMPTIRKDRNEATTIGIGIALSPQGLPVSINKVRISGDGTYYCTLRYTNSYTGTWTSIHGAASDSTLLVGRSSVFRVASYALEGPPTSLDPGILNLEFLLKKNGADYIDDDGKFVYSFLINSIDIMSVGDTKKSVFYSRSLGFEDWKGDPFTANQLALSVDEETPPGTNIDWYIALDPYEEGTLLDSSGDPIGEGAADISNFTYHTGYPASSGVLRSVLRDEGIDGFSNWEPRWMPINPVERELDTYNASGQLPPRRLDLDNYNVVATASDNWNNQRMPQVNGINFYKIHSFEEKPHSVTLRQGHNCWLAKTEVLSNEVTVEEDAFFVVEGAAEDYSIYIGPEDSPGTGHVRSPGPVVPGSISNITWYHGSVDAEEENFLTADQTSSLVADVHVLYSEGTATIRKNPAAVWSTPDSHIKFRYRYNDTESLRVYESSIYVPRQSTPRIELDDTAKLQRVTITNEDEGYVGVVHDGKELTTGGGVEMGKGWNRVQVQVHPGVVWNPVDSATIPNGSEYYAYQEPLQIVGKHTLFHEVHRDNHTYAALYPSGGGYYLAVNDPCTPSGRTQWQTMSALPGMMTSGISYYHSALGQPTHSGVIFDSAYNVSEFYDLSYSTVARHINNVMVKAVLTGDGNASPVIRSYEVRGGDELT